MLTTIWWTCAAWDKLSVTIAKHCWKHAEILLDAVVVTGPDIAAVNELAVLLLQLLEVGLLVEDVEC